MSEQIPMTYDGKTINITRVTINNSNNEGIRLPYVLVVPENISENAKLIVSCSTPESSPRKYDEEIDYLEKNNIYGYAPKYVHKLISVGYPVLFPIIPRFRGYYSTFLGSQVRNNDTSELMEWIDDDPEHYTHLEKENIDKLKDIDKQVYAMIGDSKKILENYTNIDDKVVMSGYSAGSHFANGFTALHPDIVDMEICGGSAGLQIQPFTELKGEKLNYPLGFNDIGSDKLEQYKQVSHYFYMGSEDYNNPAQIDIKDGEKTAHFSSCYTDKEVDQIDKIYKGIDQQGRFELNKMIYENLGIDSSFKKYQGDHKTVQMNEEVTNDVINWVNSKTKKQELITDKPKVLVNKKLEYKPNGFTDALLLALITGFAGGIIIIIMLNIIV